MVPDQAGGLSDACPDACERCGGAFVLDAAGRWTHECPRPAPAAKPAPPLPPPVFDHYDREEE